MVRRGLTLFEALKVFHELPLDSESERKDSSDTEVYAPEPLVQSDDDMSDETHLSDEEVDDPSQPGPSTQPQVPTWNSKQKLQKLLPEFTRISGPNAKLWELPEKTPLAVFQEIFSLQLMEHIVFQTNLYATQKCKPLSPLTLVKLYIFLGINLLMGIKRMPSYKDFLANNEALGDEFICCYMSCRRFSWILGNLHLYDNVLEPKKNDVNFDRLYKVRPLLDYLSKSFLDALHPSENQSIDESIIKFKGRSTIKQYMPKKPIKRGFKVCMRCDESAFASQFKIYSGKKEVVEKNLGEKVVKRLTECLNGKNHQVFMDNYFTTYELFRYLETKSIYACRTAMIGRKNLPKSLLAQDKELKRGEFDWAVSNDNLTCLKWKDKRCVTTLSSLPDAVDQIQIERKEKDGTKVNINCPKAIST
ncbi:piggyBac transposable element-derived protein 4-like [Stegodyphus dumicola]|uniref:piggyBac transposable element-derived protein 4-like n=1 Tax=Stegodyphus dumicola TaxID=202533 RepID=UPI0015B2B0AF|nr:piggyBac transposable element-derived protein 4-like [Stegodyphus dumicola]